jgi:hypothetical protein
MPAPLLQAQEHQRNAHLEVFREAHVRRFSFGKGHDFRRDNLEALAVERAQEALDSGAWRERPDEEHAMEARRLVAEPRKPTNRTPTRWRRHD